MVESNVSMRAVYQVHTGKALEVILWLASARPGIDIYHVVKATYFADRQHVVDYGRPLFGEYYKADRYGPLGAAVYGLLTSSPLEQLAVGNNGPMPFKTDSAWRVTAEREPNLRMLSASDVAALSQALDKVADMSFADLVDITHDDPAYIAAGGGRMSYEDMLDHDDPAFSVRAENLAESARHASF